MRLRIANFEEARAVAQFVRTLIGAILFLGSILVLEIWFSAGGF